MFLSSSVYLARRRNYILSLPQNKWGGGGEGEPRRWWDAPTPAVGGVLHRLCSEVVGEPVLFVHSGC